VTPKEMLFYLDILDTRRGRSRWKRFNWGERKKVGDCEGWTVGRSDHL